MEHVFLGHSSGNLLTKAQSPEVRKTIILKARCIIVEDLVRKQVINSHREPSLPNAPGKDKIWEEASPEAKRSGS